MSSQSFYDGHDCFSAFCFCLLISFCRGRNTLCVTAELSTAQFQVLGVIREKMKVNTQNPSDTAGVFNMDRILHRGVCVYNFILYYSYLSHHRNLLGKSIRETISEYSLTNQSNLSQ